MREVVGVGAIAGLLLAAPALGATDFWQDARPPVAAPPAAAAWARLGDRQAGQGHEAAAAAAYVAAIAAGPAPAGVSLRLGDALMAEGELASAEAAYRDAIAAADAAAAGPDGREARDDAGGPLGAGAGPGAATPRGDARLLQADPRERAQERALACVGLAAALDRAGQPEAARQMVREALAADPTASALEIATLPGADLRILPEGEVFYRLGLVRAVSGRRTDAEAAFREYLERSPQARWAGAAEAHLAELEAPPARAEKPSRPGGPRLLATATVLASGGTPAPLIDAAWRTQASILDDCLDGAAGWARPGAPARIAVEIQIDRRGRVVAATAKLPFPDSDGLARCLEDAVRGGLRLPAPAGARPTRARTELLVGFPAPDRAGYR
jgi:tetratricopeptide (TPR) repeat protein